MCFRSTIQKDERSPPPVRAVILTKWTSASRHTDRRKMVVMWERGTGNFEELPFGLGLSVWWMCGQSMQVRLRLRRENSSVHLHFDRFLTFIAKFGEVGWHMLWSCRMPLHGVNEATFARSLSNHTWCPGCDKFRQLKPDKIVIECRFVAEEPLWATYWEL